MRDGTHESDDSEAGADINGCDIMFRVSQMLRVFEDLICGRGDGEWVFACLSQLQGQAQVFLHVTQGHLTVDRCSIRLESLRTKYQ